MEIKFGDSRGYILHGGLLRSLLENNNKMLKGTVGLLGQAVTFNAIREISIAVFEALKNELFRNALLNDIFLGDESHFTNFEIVLRLVRNCFSHNINNEFELKSEDFQKQKKWCEGKGLSEIIFSYDYSSPKAFVQVNNYNFVITFKWADVHEGKKFLKIIGYYELFMLMEFCFNLLTNLQSRYEDGSSNKSLQMFDSRLRK